MRKAVLAVALIAACAEQPKPDSAAATGDSAVAVPASADSVPVVEPESGGDWKRGVITVDRPGEEAALLTGVRAASHPGFDRIVFEFGGSSVPGYRVSYIDRPVRSCGSGEVVPLPGDGWLEVRFFPANAHNEAGAPTVRERSIDAGLPNVRKVVSTCDFEADVTWVAGVLSPNDFRVMELKSPSRLVLDIQQR